MKYQLKKQELFKACFYIVWQYFFKTICRKKRGILLLAVLFLLFFAGRPGRIVLLLWLLWYLLSVIRTYRVSSREGILNGTELSLENGILRFGRGQTYTECSASKLSRVVQKKELLFITIEELMGQERYFIIPDRAFSGEQEKNDFLKALARAAGCPEEQKEGQKAEPLYQFAFFADKDFLVNSIALASQENMNDRKYYRFLAGGKRAVQKRLIRQLEKMAAKGKFLEMLGNWQTVFCETYVLVKFNGLENHVDYTAFQKLLDSPDMYIFYGGKYGYSFGLPKRAVPVEQQEEFLAFCRERISCCRQVERIKKKGKMSKASRMLLLTVVLLVLGAAVMTGLLVLEGKNKIRNHTREDHIPEYDADFKFIPSEYPDYLPIEDQIQVLRELGFEVPEGAADYYHGWLDDNEYGKLHVEGYPYYVLLSDLGTPNYDMDTYRFLGYSEQVYWFSYESWDISKDYINILEGVQALTGEEVVFVGMNEDCEDVNWKKGTGTIRVTFWLNGRPYEFKANVDGDWLDKDFIAFLNGVLDEEGFEKQLFASSDHDEGCILFYRDEEWAEKFTERTGLALSETAK